MRGALSALARRRTTVTGGMIVSVIGDTFADVVCRPLERLPAWGTDTLVSEPIRVMLGGSAANFAVHSTNLNRAQPLDYAQRNGASSAAATAGSSLASAVEVDDASTKKRQTCVLHTSVGSDDMGDFVRRKLDEHGVEWYQAKSREHQGACVVLSGREDRSFVTHRGATAQFCREDIDVPRLLQSSHVHVAGFYNCPALWGDLPGLLAEAKAGGASCSLVPQWDASQEWGGLEPLYHYLDVFIPNEVEALNISGCADIDEAASFFLEKGVGLVVITRGGNGAFAASKRRGGRGGGMADVELSRKKRGEGDGEEGAGGARGDGSIGAGGSGGAGSGSGGRGGLQLTWEQRCRPVEIVDTTGAGDAFSAGFLHVWKATGGGIEDAGGGGGGGGGRGGDVQAALRWGCALGTAVVTRTGASPKLSVDEDVRPNLV